MAGHGIMERDAPILAHGERPAIGGEGDGTKLGDGPPDGRPLPPARQIMERDHRTGEIHASRCHGPAIGREGDGYPAVGIGRAQEDGPGTDHGMRPVGRSVAATPAAYCAEDRAAEEKADHGSGRTSHRQGNLEQTGRPAMGTETITP
jgi:hypothetical protein